MVVREGPLGTCFALVPGHVPVGVAMLMGHPLEGSKCPLLGPCRINSPVFTYGQMGANPPRRVLIRHQWTSRNRPYAVDGGAPPAQAIVLVDQPADSCPATGKIPN